MPENTDEALADVPPQPELDPKTYDMDDFLRGVRPLRLSVDLVSVNDPDGSAAARLAEIDAEVDRLPDGRQADALIDEAIALQERVVTRTTVVLEQRSMERIEATRKSAMAAVGVEAGKDWTQAETDEVTLRILLDQIVSPDLSIEDLQGLYRETPDQVDLLATTLQRVNAGAAGSAGLTRDFSRRRSTSRATRRSSTR